VVVLSNCTTTSFFKQLKYKMSYDLQPIAHQGAG